MKRTSLATLAMICLLMTGCSLKDEPPEQDENIDEIMEHVDEIRAEP